MQTYPDLAVSSYLAKNLLQSSNSKWAQARPMRGVVVMPFGTTPVPTWPDEHDPDDGLVLLVLRIHFDCTLVSDRLIDARRQALPMPIQNAEYVFFISVFLMAYLAKDLP